MLSAITSEWGHITVRDQAIPELHPGECLIQVRYAGICGSDVHIYQGHHPTAKAPVIQGHEFTGTLVKIGPDTETDISIGDRVVVEPLLSCGRCEACRTGTPHVCRKLGLLGIHVNGAFSEYVRVSANKMIKVPDKLNDKIAALTEPFAVGFHVCSRGDLRNGDKALIVGAGPIGLIIGMVAKISGATVTFAEINKERLTQAQTLGFATIDCNAEPVAAGLKLTEQEGFDVVFEASGSQAGTLLASELCRIRGKIVQVGFFGKRPETDLMKLIFREQTLIGSRVYTFEDFRRTVHMLSRIVEEKLLHLEALISDVLPLADVEKGITQMLNGSCKGKILLEINPR